MVEFLVKIWWLAPLFALVASIATVRTFPAIPHWRIALAVYLFSVTVVPSVLWACTNFEPESGTTLIGTLGLASLFGFFHRELLTAIRGAISQPKVGIWMICLGGATFLWFIAHSLVVTAMVYATIGLVVYKLFKKSAKKS